MYAYWVCAAREDPHLQSWISVPEHIIFTNFLKIRSGASPFNIFWRDFAVPETIIFKNFFNFNPFIASHGRLSPNAKRLAAPRVSQTRPGSSGDWHFHAQNGPIKLVPEPHIFKLKTAQARSGAPHFHARPRARSGVLAHFSLCRGTYLPKFGVSTPPPPGSLNLTTSLITPLPEYLC